MGNVAVRRVCASPIDLAPGEYGFFSGEWWVFPPPSERYPQSTFVRIPKHKIVDENGVLTVEPSILIRGHEGVELWHGWLRQNTWEEC